MLRFHTGFALMEVMIVIAIFVIFASITVPSFTKARKRAIVNWAKDILVVIHVGEMGYKLANGTYYGISGIQRFVNAEWAKIDIDNPNVRKNDVTFLVALPGGGFMADAQLRFGLGGTQCLMRLDQDRLFTFVNVVPLGCP